MNKMLYLCLDNFSKYEFLKKLYFKHPYIIILFIIILIFIIFYEVVIFFGMLAILNIKVNFIKW